MIKIAKAHIRNFRVIEDLELDFCDEQGKPLDLIVFAGANGSGKTSILEALVLALGRDDLLPEKRKPVFNVRSGESRLEIELDLHNSETQLPLKIGFAQSPAGTEVKNQPPEHTKAQHQFPLDYFSSRRQQALVGSLPVTVGKPVQKPNPAEGKRLSIFKQYMINLIARKAFQASALSYPTEDEDIFRRLNEVWRCFYSEQHQRFEAGTASEIVMAGFDIFLKDEESNQRIAADSLSSGEIELLTLFGWVFMKINQRTVIFILDEPELHMHPKWQRIFLNTLRTVLPSAQIICATHSPQVISEIPAESMFILKPVNNRIAVFKPESALWMDSNRILEDLLDTPERPPEPQQRLSLLFDLIDRGQLAEARAIEDELRQVLINDPELVRAEVLIRRKEAIGR